MAVTGFLKRCLIGVRGVSDRSKNPCVVREVIDVSLREVSASHLVCSILTLYDAGELSFYCKLLPLRAQTIHLFLRLHPNRPAGQEAPAK